MCRKLIRQQFVFLPAAARTDKKVSGKSKDEQMAEKKQELEKRLQDVTGQLGTNKKTAKKGKICVYARGG